MTAHKGVHRLGIECNIRDSIRDIRLEAHAADRLILQLQLRYLRRQLYLRIINGSAARGIQIQNTGNLDVSGFQRLELIQANAGGLQLPFVPLSLREVCHVAAGRPCGHLYGQTCLDLITRALEGDVRRLNRFVSDCGLSQSDITLADRIELGTMNRGLCRKRTGHRRLHTRQALQLRNVQLRGIKVDLNRARLLERPLIQPDICI